MSIFNNPTPPTEKSFGLTFAVIFLILGFYSAFKLENLGITIAFLVVATLFLIAALRTPKILQPLNKAWFSFGLLLGRVVSPLVLGAIFFLLITPLAVSLRFFGRDELRIRKRKVDSYWIQREPVGTDADSFKNQF